ncbi:MAG TPA: hypothetical protein VFW83_10695 [Bryobacteraceae bacterium]|nr:hypothetical protein [Bryobacteraceae bacterium]
MAFASSSRPDAAPQTSIMEEAGQKLKLVRERLQLKYRDVEEASERIARMHQNEEYLLVLSRLSDIENKGVLPTVYRLYSLCAIYRLDVSEVLSWYGICLDELPADASLFKHARTHPVGFRVYDEGEVQVPIALDPGIDLSRTSFLSRMIQRWGKVPLLLLQNIDLRTRLYGLIGTEDWSMFPLVPPGSLVVIDDSRRRIVNSGWVTEFERPIYFLEHRTGYACGWCSLHNDRLVIHPHPASFCEPESYVYPDEIEVIGQVTQIAMTVDPALRRRPRS